MRPTSRLDLLVVPSDPDAPPERATELIRALGDAGVTTSSGGPGPAADRWIVGGFGRIHLDRPGGLGFWSNRQGGFAVRCPVTDAPVVEAFAAAMGAWRDAGGGPPPTVPCPSCGRPHRADELRFLPEAAFGPWALVTGTAAGSELAPDGERLLRDVLGSWRAVLRRG